MGLRKTVEFDALEKLQKHLEGNITSYAYAALIIVKCDLKLSC